MHIAALVGTSNFIFSSPAIAQLVEHLTVDPADIRWSLVRFRVAGFVQARILNSLVAF